MKKREYRQLGELNLIDNFLFGETLNDPETGKEFAAIMLKIITGRKFENLKIVSQKQIYGADTEYHGARLDVYIEESQEGELATVYDVEPEKKHNKKDVTAIPQRTRFYHAKISGLSLKSGEPYGNLKNVLVIMITPFDPFDRGRMMYTIKNRCIEEPDMPYEDGATTIFLYTKGKKGIPSQEMKDFLKYFEYTVADNAVNPDLQKIDEMVKRIKQNAKVGVRHMQIMRDERELIEEGMAQGIKQGIAQEKKNTRKAEKRAQKAEQKNEELLELLRKNGIPISGI